MTVSLHSISAEPRGMMMHSHRVTGLAWAALLSIVTAVAAQATPERPLPPIRLPGVMYPDQTETAPVSPEAKSKGRHSRPVGAAITPASPPTHPVVVAEPDPPRRAGSQTLVNEPETTAAVTVRSEAVTLVEPLALSTHRTQQLISPEAVTARGFALAGSFALALASLASASLAVLRRRRSDTPIWTSPIWAS
jgi:hypothetical protein